MEPFSSADGFVFTMLGVICISFGMVALLLLSIRRNLARRDPPVDDLIDEVTMRPQMSGRKGSKDMNGQKKSDLPWEKDPDWWKR